jgi:DNA-binding NtrC family response regulator
MSKLDALLVIDDDLDVQQAACLVLASVASRIDTCSAVGEVASLVSSRLYDCILLDMNFEPGVRSGDEGLACLDVIRQQDRAAAVILMTAFGGVSLAVDGLKRGASDFILKPWRNEALVMAVYDAAKRTLAARMPEPLDNIERDAIESALAIHRGNIAKAAVTLGLSRPALYRRMSRHGF